MNRARVLLCAGLLSALRPGEPAHAQAAAEATAVERAVRQAYEREFGLTIERPAIYNDPRSADCRGNSHITSTAYLPRSATEAYLYSLYLSRDATSLLERRATIARRPAGTFRVLTVLLRYPETTGEDALALWESAQAMINGDHAAFAKRTGLDAPIVRFENTHVALHGVLASDPRSIAGLQTALANTETSLTGSDVVVSINIDPSRVEGGFANQSSHPPFVYVGNYAKWQTKLGPRDFALIARTAYHHEVAHHWGWDHRWSMSCGRAGADREPFPAAPILFGWEDVDEDGLPEILDPTPYGRRK